MTIGEVTKTYRKDRKMSQEDFAEAITEALPNDKFDAPRASISNWERNVNTPSFQLLMLVMMKYGDWRRDWALKVLSIMKPDVFTAPEEVINA